MLETYQSVGEVVGVEQGIAFQSMPLLCLQPARHRATSPRLCIAREQAGQGGDCHEMLFVQGVGPLTQGPTYEKLNY